MTLKVGGLFAGYGGLELGLSAVLDCEPTWFAELDNAPSKVLAHHWPHVPNHGDVTKVDWAAAEPVDVITGGSPCQDLSHAGKRLGMKAGTRSGLWAAMCDAIETIRPSLVVWENVRGALSAEADSAVEPCPLCVGDRAGPTLRALGRVLGDLAELRYDAWWCGLRAADVGAAHGRFRVFVFATPADTDPPGWGYGQGAHGWESDALRAGAESGLTLLPTPTSSDAKASGAYGYDGNEFCTLTDATVRQAQDWREYEAAIRRQETAFGRPAPPPTEPGRNGQPRLSPKFVEWLMGLPAGWVTGVPGTRNDQLKALGNGVVPQQAAAATWAFLDFMAKEKAA